MKIEELKNFGVSESVIQKLTELRFKELTEIQEKAVKKGLFEGKNQVISAPTNTGKTFISELATLNASKQRESRRTFYLVPLKALAEEKFEEFREKYSKWGLKIAITTSERTEYDVNLLGNDLIIATYEKLNALLIRYPNIINGIGVVVIDELQNIGDMERGVNLEVLLTRLVHYSGKKPQLIGLSATIPNASQLSKWLNAELIETSKREVELKEGILYTGEEKLKFKEHVLNKGDFLYREFNSGKIRVERNLNLNTIEAFAKLCETEQLIIFEDTRRNAEILASGLSVHLPPAKNINKWIEEMDTRIESTPSSRDLKKCMINGVAFHHAGLLLEERKTIEQAFEDGDIRAICSTSTLGAGVNTPAKTVIVRSYKLWDNRSIPTRDYKNMAGRAGRMKHHDDFGRSLIFANSEKDCEIIWNSYIDAQPEEVKSQINKQDNIELSILGLVASDTYKNITEILNFIENTFFGYTYRSSEPKLIEAFQESIKKQILRLCKDGFLRCKNGEIKITELGKRCAEELLSPKSIKLICQSLKKIEKEISRYKTKNLLEPIIHLACCTFDASGSLLFSPIRAQEKKKTWIYWKVNKKNYLAHPDETELILSSVKTTQMLLRWIDGIPYSELRGFAPQGIVKRTAGTISWVIRGIARVAEKPLFNFDENFIDFLNVLSKRVKFGVKENAIEIMKLEIPTIHRHRAMELAQAGYSTLNSLIEANINELKEVPSIGSVLASRIKEHVEYFIRDRSKRKYQSQIRHAKELGRDTEIIEKLYKETGDNFSKVCSDIFCGMELSCKFIGDLNPHDPDCLIELDEGRIVIECKREKGKNLVSAKEAEEIRGKGAKYRPIAEITVGYPDFSDNAINNVKNTHITLITHTVLAEILIKFWEGKITKDKIIEILKSGKYINEDYVNNLLFFETEH